MRSGQEYVAALRDGRAGEPTSLPTTSYVDPATRQRYSAKWLIPRSAEDLDARRRVHRFWAEPTFGHMGRTPDHVASAITAFAASADLFGRGGARFAEHVRRFYERARQEDLYL